MAEMTTTEIREHLSEVINQVAFGKERVQVTRRGKVVAVLIPAEDLEALEAFEDRLDVVLAEKALAESDELVSWDGLKASVGL